VVWPGNACVVDEDVDVAFILLDGLDDVIEAFLVGYIALDWDDRLPVAVDRFGGFGEGLIAAGEDVDAARSGSVECCCYRQANSCGYVSPCCLLRCGCWEQTCRFRRL